MKPSKRSHRPGRERCHLASGDMTWGCPTMKAGEMQRGSMNSPTSWGGGGLV
jgi:hypothetical protein